ncbi:putative holin-like toxin [Secundilactobacillus mixtipabuli]|uniref:Holin-like toxin n=1 Tax=Secundilactobacillus mixtipabuli TaxID=1435342 RepID=A0A1Z5IA91_9LACO|nr:hypothetical protein IWT30_00405 [Secundilactobacillus mixtipabuli]
MGGGVNTKVDDAHDLQNLRKIQTVSVFDTLSLMIAFATLTILIDRGKRK